MTVSLATGSDSVPVDVMDSVRNVNVAVLVSVIVGKTKVPVGSVKDSVAVSDAMGRVIEPVTVEDAVGKLMLWLGKLNVDVVVTLDIGKENVFVID